jgi:hypothetical protein
LRIHIYFTLKPAHISLKALILPNCIVIITKTIRSLDALSVVPCARTCHTPASGAFLGSVAMRRTLEPGPSRGNRGVLSVLFTRSLVVPPRDRGVRRPRLPSSGSRIVGSSSRCYRVIQVDARAPFDRGRLVVRRHVHESAHVGVLGRARSRSMGA